MQTPTKPDIRLLSKDELIESLVSLGEKKFRAKQIEEWLWVKGARSFEEMTNLSKGLRQILETNFGIYPVQIAEEQISNDKTIKVAFELHDGKICEGVLIPAGDRMTACISSQVGCSLACEFCATGKLKRERNITYPEIYDQVWLINQIAQKYYQKKLSNIVFMGMGEPLMNYKNVKQGIEKITQEIGLQMSPRRITLSTAGVAKMITRMADEKVRFPLALSLHAATDEKRTKIMQINETNNLEALSQALQYYYEQTGNQITLEYIIFKDFNDSIEDAKNLHQFAKKVPCKINILEYNPIDDGGFKKADPKKVDAFKDYLEGKRLIVNIRRSRGKDIDAACGQLANKNSSVK